MSPDPDICYTEDEENIVNMLHYIKCDEVSVRNAVRLGRRSDKPRPLKLTIAYEEQKENIFWSAKDLKGRQESMWNKVFIHQDMTPKQREKRKKFVLELKARANQ
jgi:hypothetical protein